MSKLQSKQCYHAQTNSGEKRQTLTLEGDTGVCAFLLVGGSKVLPSTDTPFAVQPSATQHGAAGENITMLSRRTPIVTVQLFSTVILAPSKHKQHETRHEHKLYHV